MFGAYYSCTESYTLGSEDEEAIYAGRMRRVGLVKNMTEKKTLWRGKRIWV